MVRSLDYGQLFTRLDMRVIFWEIVQSKDSLVDIVVGTCWAVSSEDDEEEEVESGAKWNGSLICVNILCLLIDSMRCMANCAPNKLVGGKLLLPNI